MYSIMMINFHGFRSTECIMWIYTESDFKININILYIYIIYTEHVHNRRQKYITNSLFNIGARAINIWACVYVYVCVCVYIYKECIFVNIYI